MLGKGMLNKINVLKKIIIQYFYMKIIKLKNFFKPVFLHIFSIAIKCGLNFTN